MTEEGCGGGGGGDKQTGGGGSGKTGVTIWSVC